MTEFKFMHDGKEIPPDKLGDILYDQIVSEIIERVKRATQSISCDVHNTPSNLVIDIADEITFSMECCCQEYKSKLESAVQGALS